MFLKSVSHRSNSEIRQRFFCSKCMPAIQGWFLVLSPFQYFKKIPLSYVCEINRSWFFSLEEILSLAGSRRVSGGWLLWALALISWCGRTTPILSIMSLFREWETLVQGFVDLNMLPGSLKTPLLSRVMPKTSWQENMLKRTSGQFGFRCRTCIRHYFCCCRFTTLSLAFTEMSLEIFGGRLKL